MNKTDVLLIKKALLISALREAEAFERLPDAEFVPSEEHKKRMQVIINGESKAGTGVGINRKRLAVAMIAAAIIVSLLTACAVIKPIRNFFIEIFEEYISLAFESNENSGATTIEKYYKLTFIPEGFECVSERRSISKLRLKYESQENLLIFEQTLYSNGFLKIDHKDAKIENIVINGIEMTSFTKNGQTSLYWEDGTYVFSLSFPECLTDDEVEKIINGITEEE